jgi:hypothetical protein
LQQVNLLLSAAITASGMGWLAYCTQHLMLQLLLLHFTGCRLQEVNPLPFVAMIANGMGWLAYGLYIHDFFVFGSNTSALVLGVFYVMTCSKFADEKVRWQNVSHVTTVTRQHK